MFESIIPYWARVRPEAPALVLSNSTISFGQFEDTIQSVTSALAEWSLPHGSKVVVADTRPYLHWATIFALDRLGYVSISDDRSSSALSIPSIAGVVAESAARVPAGLPRVITDREWFERALRMPRWPLSRIRRDAGDRARILLSSGTTGRPKQCLFTRAVIDVRVTRRAATRPHFKSVFASALGLGTAGGFLLALGSWASGGAVAYGTVSLADTLARLNPDHVMLSPQHLQQLLRETPSYYVRRDDLTLLVTGGATPPNLSLEARERLTPDVRLLYSSTEGGGIASINSALPIAAQGGIGYANPWARLEVVDTEGRAVAPNEHGILRVLGDEVLAEYDEEPNHPAFRDGWFYPGDMGSILPDGMIVLSGRVDDLLNIGGTKVSAFDLEQQLLQVSGVSDAAVLPFRASDGIVSVLAAVVIEPSVPFETVKSQIRDKTKYRMSVTPLAKLPRNDMGKLVRKELEAALAAAGAFETPPTSATVTTTTPLRN